MIMFSFKSMVRVAAALALASSLVGSASASSAPPSAFRRARAGLGQPLVAVLAAERFRDVSIISAVGS